MLFGKEGMAITGMDHAFNRVELLWPLPAFPDEAKNTVFGNGFFSASELSFRVRLDAAEAKTMAS